MSSLTSPLIRTHHPTIYCPFASPRAQTFSGILLLIGAAVNYFYETYYCEPKLRVLFDKLRPHLQVLRKL
jgi:hypothetical protein